MKRHNIVITSFKQRDVPVLEQKRAMSEKIAEETEAFLASGKSVTEVDAGVSNNKEARPLYRDYMGETKPVSLKQPPKTWTKRIKGNAGDWGAYIAGQD